MGIEFIGNPYGHDDADSDFEGNTDDDWITLPNDMIILDTRDQAIMDPTFGIPDSSDDDESWPDEIDNDEEYDLEEYSSMGNIQDNDSYDSNPALNDPNIQFFLDDSDSDNEEEYDYVTYPFNSPTNPESAPDSVKTLSEEINTNNQDNADGD